MTPPNTTLTAAGAATQPPGALMAAEILEQPQALARQLDHGRPEIRRLATVLRDADIRYVLLAARGTSDHAALYAKYLIETVLGLPGRARVAVEPYRVRRGSPRWTGSCGWR